MEKRDGFIIAPPALAYRVNSIVHDTVFRAPVLGERARFSCNVRAFLATLWHISRGKYKRAASLSDVCFGNVPRNTHPYVVARTQIPNAHRIHISHRMQK